MIKIISFILGLLFGIFLIFVFTYGKGISEEFYYSAEDLLIVKLQYQAKIRELEKEIEILKGNNNE